MLKQVIRARDPVIWASAAKVIYQGLSFDYPTPKKLRTIGFPTPGKAAAEPLTNEINGVILNFLNKFQIFLGTNASILNETTLWESTKPNASLPSLNSFLNLTYEIIISKEQTKLLRDPFYADYGAKHSGRRPFVNPSPLVRPKSFLLSSYTGPKSFGCCSRPWR